MSRAKIIRAIVAKDFRELSRDRFYVVVSVLGIVFYVAIFWILPSRVDETLKLGVHGGAFGEILATLTGDETGLRFEEFETEADLEAAVAGETDSDVVAGVSFPPDFVSTTAAGGRSTVTVYVPGDLPDEIRFAVSAFVREMAYTVAGNPPPVMPPDPTELVLGVDRVGAQVSLQERMRPLLVFFILILEILALGSLVASEIQQRTVTAVLTTPARISDFLAAKGIFGTLLAFGQALLLLALIGSLGTSPDLMAVILLLGAILATGIGLVAGSFGKDFITIAFISVAFMVPLMVPAIAALFPGTASAWVRALPTYGLVQAIVGVTTYGERWAETMPNLALLAAWCVAVFAMGWMILKRRVATL